MRMIMHTLKHAAVFVAALGIANSAAANFKTLAQKLPASSNAIVALNVTKLLDTPYAKTEEWAKNCAAPWAKDPMMIPPGSTRLLMASEVQTNSMESVWEMTLMEMEQMPDLKALAAAEGGNI